eukprot:Sspe_Gene.79685::Locus_50013_Transcript_1_1_Confidence_1.000_Length_477::g.79685::m.79685
MTKCGPCAKSTMLHRRGGPKNHLLTTSLSPTAPVLPCQLPRNGSCSPQNKRCSFFLAHANSPQVAKMIAELPPPEGGHGAVLVATALCCVCMLSEELHQQAASIILPTVLCCLGACVAATAKAGRKLWREQT